MRAIKSARDRTDAREGGRAWIHVEDTIDDEIRDGARNAYRRVSPGVP